MKIYVNSKYVGWYVNANSVSSMLEISWRHPNHEKLTAFYNTLLPWARIYNTAGCYLFFIYSGLTWAFVLNISYQVWEELSFYESGLWKRLLTLFTELTGRGRAQDSKRPCSIGTLTESTVFWGESGRISEAVFLLATVFVLSLCYLHLVSSGKIYCFQKITIR